MTRSFGARLEGLVIYYRQEQHMSYERTQTALWNLHGVAISQGGIDQIMQRAGQQAVAATVPLQHTIQESAVVNSDETSARVDGRNWWEWVFCAATAVLHVIKPSRGADVIGAVMGPHCAEVWGSDCWSAQLKAPAQGWQLCLAQIGVGLEVTDLRVVGGANAEIPDDATWDAFVAGSPGGHLLQTSRWGHLKVQFGWTAERVALMQGDSPIAGAQVLYRALPFGQTLAYVARGPVVDWDDTDVVMALLRALRAAARRRRAFCLKIEPDLIDHPNRARGLVALGLRPSLLTLQPRSTILVDLCRTEDDLLARMKPKCRYNIRLASRKGVVVRDATEADLPLFVRLLEETARREKFVVHSGDYYSRAYRLFVPSGSARLLLAAHEGSVLAGIMVFASGRKGWYLYGASGNVHRNLMPNHLLQWRAMQWARSSGCTSYDLWGIPDEVGQDPENFTRTFTDHTGDLWGVYRFKQGFGGQVVRYVGAYDDVYHDLPYQFYHRLGALLERWWGGAWHRRFRAG